uniref:Uncharacterized protein LOC104218697 n=1 Tax=Nicotiana sylvestris TaxID=4096 RepID=A0A1U7VMG6_NICSY|nr:PREDICTED: uncharacterized protein LOC104218697 [Nicotiana sylvestris]
MRHQGQSRQNQGHRRNPRKSNQQKASAKADRPDIRPVQIHLASSDRCHKFFGVLKKDNVLQWNSECINALQELKAYLSSPLLLAKAEPGERLLVYLAVSDVAVSAVLVEVGAFAQIHEQEVITFIWQNIICRFDISKEIGYDNEPQFTGKKVVEFFEKWNIKKILCTPYHPTADSQAESSNKTILNIMKKKLENAKGPWPKVLPRVLWAYHTTPNTSIGETPYSLAYGTDAVIPFEVGEPSLRYSKESGPSNNENRRQYLDEVEERRNMAYIGMVAQKKQVGQ